MPEVSVIQQEQVLFGLTVCKECKDCSFNNKVKKENLIFLDFKYKRARVDYKMVEF